MRIEAKNIMEPPEKVLLMYQAVSELIRESNDISVLKVQDITRRAGIGKGTAYEYFSSKEDIIAHALVYEYGLKLQELIERAYSSNDFRERCYNIMRWISDNKEYNRTFLQTFHAATGKKLDTSMPPIGAGNECKERPFLLEIRKFIFDEIDKFMEEGYMQKAFTEVDEGRRCQVLLMSMVEYGAMISLGLDSRYKTFSEEENREYIYKRMIASLRV